MLFSQHGVEQLVTIICLILVFLVANELERLTEKHKYIFPARESVDLLEMIISLVLGIVIIGLIFFMAWGNWNIN